MIAPIRRALKRGFAQFAAWVLKTGPRPRAATPERILVLRIDERVGNVLLITPLLVALKEAFPRAKLEILVAANKAKIITGLADPIPFEKRDFFRRPWKLYALLRDLRRRAFDVVIDASHWHHFSLSSALLLGYVGAPVRIAHDRGDAARFATDPIPAPSDPEPEIATKLRLLAPLGVTARAAPMRTALGTDPAAVARIDAWIKASGWEGRALVGLAPGSRKIDHRADPAVYGALGVTAHELGAQPIVLWGPGEEALAADVATRGRAIVAPPTNLEELAALMRRCRAVVANDTGPMHLAVACEAPTLALFQGADPRRWGHAQAPNVVLDVAGRGVESVSAEARVALAAILKKPAG
jgi:heptosyltransferase III